MRQRLCRQLPLARDGNHTAQTHSSHCVYVPVTAAMLQMRAASTLTRSNSVRPSAAHPGSDARPLFIDLPGKGLALRAQRSNLDKFLQSNAAAYAELPYLPWTKPAHKSGIATEIVSSKLDGCAGLRGVTLVQDLITGDRDVPLLYYSGLLMNEAMYQQFADEYHCPTALELPSLAYTDARTAQRHKMILIGDPTTAGAIINDGVYSGLEGQFRSRRQQLRGCRFRFAHCMWCCSCAANCKLQSVKMAARKDALTKHKNGKLIVSAQVAAIYALPGQHLRAGTELLLDYGGKSFWTDTFISAEYCAQCFARHSPDDNPLILCGGKLPDGNFCSCSRHRLCFPAHAIPSTETVFSDEVAFYCPDHMAQARPQPHAPIPGRQVQLRFVEQWTPPPVRHFHAPSPPITSAPLVPLRRRRRRRRGHPDESAAGSAMQLCSTTSAIPTRASTSRRNLTTSSMTRTPRRVKQSRTAEASPKLLSQCDRQRPAPAARASSALPLRHATRQSRLLPVEARSNRAAARPSEGEGEEAAADCHRLDRCAGANTATMYSCECSMQRK
jgi:hypothetical protein